MACSVCRSWPSTLPSSSLPASSIPIKEVYFEEDHKDQALRFFRLLKWRPLQVVDKFGEDTPGHIKEKAKSSNTDERVEIIFCIYERDNYRDPYSGKPLAPHRRPYGYKYVLHSDGSQIGKEGGYYEMPAFLPRWQKVSGSVWGHSPSHLCLSTVLSLNQAWELFFAAWEKGIDPTQLTDQRNLYGDFDHGAGKVNTVRDINKIRELVPTTRMDMTAFGMETLKQQIRDAFHVNQLELKDSPAMTATEVMARMDLMNRLLGPTMGRLQNDMLDPLLQRAFRILWRNGQLPEAPTEVLQANAELDIEYQGPLARSTKLDEIVAADQYVGNLVAMSTQAPQAARALDNIDWDAYARGMAEMRQVPIDYLRSQEEVDKQREHEAAMAGQREGVVAAGEAGMAAKAVGEGQKAMQEAAGNVTPISR